MVERCLMRQIGGYCVDFALIIVFLQTGLNVEIGDCYDVIR